MIAPSRAPMFNDPLPAAVDTAFWDALPGMVLRLASDGGVRQVNAALVEFTGVPAPRLLGDGWRALLVEGARSAWDAALAQHRAFSLQLQLTLDGTHTTATGGSGWVACEARWNTLQGEWICLLHDVTSGKLAEAAVRARASLFHLLADNVPALIAYYRASDLQCRFANKGYARTFGLDERSILGKTFAEVIGADAAREIQPQVERVMHQRQAVSYERRIGRDDESARWIDVNLLPHLDDRGEIEGAFVLVTDVTKYRVAEQALRESEERLGKFMQASAEGIVFHKDGYITDVNPPLCTLLGYSMADMLGRKTLEFVAADHVARVAAVIASGQETTYESVLLDKRGQRIAVEFIVRTMVRHGERLRMTIVRDIRDREASQARIHHLAHHDALTGLPNRMAFMNRLDQEMAAARANGSRLALLFIDLDHFKRVNDSLGHLVGDTLLRTVGGRITHALRGTDLVARFGGDEFMVLLPGVPLPPQLRHDLDEVAQKLLAAIQVPVDAEGQRISVTPSIGISLYPGDGDTPDDLIKHADSAMYQAKTRGRATHQFFDPGMASSAYAALVVEGELSHALERGEFELFYQPQVRARDGVLVGAEALLRWNHPERGLVMPDEFVPVAEQQRLMLPIGQWALKEAAICATRWQALGMAVAPVAVNLSTVQFQSVGFVEAVAEVLDNDGDTRISHGLIELELTERMLMDDLGEVKQRLAHLKSMGLGIAVDDFGTGYSSLAHLKELPIDKIKIDRSFVHDLPGNRDSSAITRAIIQMGRSLGLTVIAEGVETEAQRDFLAGQGCDELQGLLIGAPLPRAEFEVWVSERRAQERARGLSPAASAHWPGGPTL
jgi:diguanylate cyclase (GGDEF)-like protein/PAS domain S-box-containing protein